MVVEFILGVVLVGLIAFLFYRLVKKFSGDIIDFLIDSEVEEPKIEEPKEEPDEDDA